MVDVVIVGAGAAGVSAGLELASRGLSFVIVEASDRIGGRAYTDRTSLPGHWDQGGQWFHCADVNPLVPLAQTLGWDFEREDRTGNWMSFRGSRWLGAAEGAAEDAALQAGFEAVYAAGGTGRDVPAHHVLATLRPAIVDQIFRLMSSEDPDKVSTLGHSDYADTEVNWIVSGGLGALIGRLSQGLPIRTNVAVTGIDTTAGGVRVETAQGNLEARAAIVTASTNVLLSGAIRFGPGPAQAVLDLMQDLPCGAYEKLALAFDRLPFDPGDRLMCSIASEGAPLPMNFQIVAGPTPKLIAHLGGKDARAIAAMRLGEATALARDALTAAFGGDAAKAITGAAMTSWSSNPWTRGAYSHARVGAGTVRRSMIAVKTGAVRFAGEAFSQPWHTTVHGAWASGKDVAVNLAESLSRAG